VRIACCSRVVLFQVCLIHVCTHTRMPSQGRAGGSRPAAVGRHALLGHRGSDERGAGRREGGTECVWVVTRRGAAAALLGWVHATAAGSRHVAGGRLASPGAATSTVHSIARWPGVRAAERVRRRSAPEGVAAGRRISRRGLVAWRHGRRRESRIWQTCRLHPTERCGVVRTSPERNAGAGRLPICARGRWPMLSPEAVSGRYRSTQTSGFVPPPHACKAGLGSSQTAT